MLSAVQRVEAPELLTVSGSLDIHGSLVSDTLVRRNCSLHVSGNLLGDLTIEPGAKVTVEGSVDGKILNKGGTLVVHNKGLAACVTLDGPPEALAGGIMKINLSALAANFEALAGRSGAKCAGMLRGNAYGCGIEPIAGALARSGCKTFFVSNLPEAKRVRAVAPKSVIYVLNGLYSGSGPAFAEVDARPVINSAIEMAEWDAFVASSHWSGGYALNIDTGESRLGLAMDEAAAFATRLDSVDHGITLVMSRLDRADRPDSPLNDRQIEVFRELRRLYRGVPASLADSLGIFLGAKAHCDLVRAGAALYGVNPTPGLANPMQPVIELQARIVQIRNMAPGETMADNPGWIARRRTRLALLSVGYADGYPRPANPADHKLYAVVGGHRCAVAGQPGTDLLAIDVTDLPDPTAARFGALATLIGVGVAIDDLAAAAKSPGREVLSRLGRRFHRIYYAI